MSFEPANLVSSFLISSLGLLCFSYGKRLGRPPQIAVGAVLLLYPFFVSNVLWMWGIALGVGALFLGALRAGW